MPGPSFQVRLVSDPVEGGKGLFRITLALASSASTPLQLSASDPAIAIAPSFSIPAGAVFQDVPFQIGAAFNPNHVFAIQAQLRTEIHVAYGTEPNPALPFGFSLYVNPPLSPTTLPAGSTPNYSLGITSIAGYAGSLSVSCQGLIAGATCQIPLTSVDLPAGGQSAQPFSVSASNSLALGSYPFNVL